MATLTEPAPHPVAQKGRGQIVWLASYLKSGNTWLRSLITACEQGADDEFDINALQGLGAASRTQLDLLLGLTTGELAAEEVRSLLPHAFGRWSRLAERWQCVKTHDAYGMTRQGVAVFPADATRGVIHLVRDPRDVAVSAMHHWGMTLDRTIDRLNNPNQWVAECAATSPNVPQYLSDWSSHTRSWLDSPLPRLTLRYEDFRAAPAAQFERVLQFIGLEADRATVERAVAACALERLQEQERRHGFRERLAASTAPFFREGKVGGWRQVLTTEQHARIVGAHRTTMERLGYLP